jgi:hypothetical protein
MDRECSAHGVNRNAYGVLVGKAEGKRIILRPKHRWRGNIRTNLREIEWGDIISFLLLPLWNIGLIS